MCLQVGGWFGGEVRTKRKRVAIVQKTATQLVDTIRKLFPLATMLVKRHRRSWRKDDNQEKVSREITFELGITSKKLSIFVVSCDEVIGDVILSRGMTCLAAFADKVRLACGIT